MGRIKVAGVEWPVTHVSSSPLSEYASAIREGTPRRVDRVLADAREEGGGYPFGLGYKRGRPQDVAGGVWKCELRVEIPGQITLPLEGESNVIDTGTLSGEVSAGGRMSSVNTDLGNASGKKRLYVGIGTKLLRTVSDTDFTLEDSGWTIPSGSARIYCMWEGYYTPSITGLLTRVLFVGIEEPTSNQDSALLFTADPTASPPVFSQVEISDVNNTSDRPANLWFGVALDSVRRNYIAWSQNSAGAGGETDWEGGAGLQGVNFGFIAYGADVDDPPEYVNTEIGGITALHKRVQVLGIVGSRIWLLDPLQDAQASPSVTNRLIFIDIDQNHRLQEVPTRTRNVTIGCRYDLNGVPGILYGDGKSDYWTNGVQHISLAWLRYQGRDIACHTVAYNPTSERLGKLVQADDNLSAWYEEYLPERNAWYPFSKRWTTTAAIIIPGGTERGTTLPWGAEGLRRYFCDVNTAPAITSVTATIRCRRTGTGGTDPRVRALVNDQAISSGTTLANNTNWQTVTETFTTNPSGGAAWTVTLVNAMTAGYQLDINPSVGAVRVTQFYVTVNFADGSTLVIRPTGAGTFTLFTPSAGANWENVDDATTDDDTTYNEASTDDFADTFAMANFTAVAVFHRQKHYGVPDRSNPLLTSLGADDFEDGPLSGEFPLYDGWGGPEETGVLLQGFFEGDANISASETVLWEYTLDQSTYPDFGTFTAGDQTAPLATPVTVRRFGTRVTLNRGSTATLTPNGAVFVSRGAKEPATRMRHVYDIDISKLSRERQNTLRADLVALRDAKAVRLEDDTIDQYCAATFSFEGDPNETVAAKTVPSSASLELTELL